MDVRMFTVGPVAENCFLLRQDGATEALIVDPGEEAPKLLNVIEELGLDLQAILITHTHFSGDVLFEGSVGRTDLPGGDWPTLARSIESLLERFGDEQRVFPGHMGLTTLGRGRATNPFLRELA